MKIRNAGPQDLNAVVQVILAAINREKLWKNFVPAKGSQDAAYRSEIEQLLQEHLDPSNKDWVISVADLADKSGKQPPNIVAVAIWDMSSAHEGDSKPPKVQTALRDDRLKAYVDVVANARSDKFHKYKQHSYLQLLAVHPDHQNQGYGKQLVQAAIFNAKSKGGVLTTIGGPHGYIFFSGLGFHDQGAVTLPPSTATDEQNVKALSLEVPKEERRQSLVDSLLNYISS